MNSAVILVFRRIRTLQVERAVTVAKGMGMKVNTMLWTNMCYILGKSRIIAVISEI